MSSEVDELRAQLRRATAALRQAKVWKERAEAAEASLASERATTAALRAALAAAQPRPHDAAPPPAAAPPVDELDRLLADVAPPPDHQCQSGPLTPNLSATPTTAQAELDAVMQLLNVADPPTTPSRPSQQQQRQQQQQAREAGEDGGRVATFQLKPGASSGAASTHTYTNEKNDDAAVRYWGTAAEAEQKSLPLSFKPVLGEVVRYTFVSEAQLASDLRHMHTLLRIGTLDNDTYNRQRDHMLVMRRGGPKFGANDNPNNPRFKGRAPDPEADRRHKQFEPLSKGTEQAMLRKQQQDRERKWR